MILTNSNKMITKNNDHSNDKTPESASSLRTPARSTKWTWPGTLRALLPEHLRPEVTESVSERVAELKPGASATLFGLKKRAMNGKAGDEKQLWSRRGHAYRHPYLYLIGDI